jgi:hypothetical protein
MAKRGWSIATSFVTTGDRFARGTLALLTDELFLELEFFLADAIRFIPAIPYNV